MRDGILLAEESPSQLMGDCGTLEQAFLELSQKQFGIVGHHDDDKKLVSNKTICIVCVCVCMCEREISLV